MSRSGDEPARARSALRVRLVLAVFGLLTAAGAAALTWVQGLGVPAVAFAVVALGAAVNVVVVVVRLLQGPHYQPGPGIPPYRPLPALGGRRRRRPGRMPPTRTRERLYLSMMAVCLTLIAAAWIWVRTFSTTLAVAMSVVAMVIPPVAAMVANTGWDERPGAGPPPGDPDGGDASDDGPT